MVTEYINCTELKRLIEEKKLKPAIIKQYLKEKGMIFTAANSHQFAEQVYTIFLGPNEISELKEMINHSGNFEKSLILNLVLKNADPAENIIHLLADEINQYKSTKSVDFIVERPQINEVASYASVEFSYERKLPGRNQLLESDRRSLKINIRKINNTEVLVDIRQPSSLDSKYAIKFIETIINNDLSSDNPFQIQHINLNSLSDKNKVDFFDKISSHTYDLWRLKTITGITVKQGNFDNDDDDGEMIDSENEYSETLTGISQAVLNGNGLRSNEFVQNSIEKGYYISAMKYRFEHKTNGNEFSIIISSKKNDLRVELEKTYIEDNGKIIIQPLRKSEQDDIIILFQNTANKIFKELVEQQSF